MKFVAPSDGVEYKIKFVHLGGRPRVRGVWRGDHFSHQTTCRIMSNDVCLYTGISRCSLNDPFDKESGRKISLTRALSVMCREDRRAAWEAYFSRKEIMPDTIRDSGYQRAVIGDSQ